MEIQRIDVHLVSLRCCEPFRIALGTSTENQNVVVKVVTNRNVVGWGEASPSEKVTKENPETVLNAIDKMAPKLVGVCPLRIEKATELIDETVVGNPSAKAAIDIALHDIMGKTARRPLFMLLGGYRHEVLTDITLGIKSPKQMARDAVKAVNRGFKAVKVKVGVNPEEDLERVKLIREAIGPEITLRIDANQGWTPDQAIDVLRKMEKFNIEFVEQPVKAEDIKRLSECSRELFDTGYGGRKCSFPEDTVQLIHTETVDLINIKLMKCGGILKARKIAAIAEAANIPCMTGCMGESRLGITAGVHVAAATKNIHMPTST